MNVEIVINAKGGIGKSFLSVQIADFLRRRWVNLLCYDADSNSNNKTFMSYYILIFP